MKYSEAVDYLDGKVILGVKPSLDRIGALCDRMGDPQGAYDAIQVTGTNGKTSVSHMLASILQACGYRVGLFTSPHLETVRERIRVNGRLITIDDFAEVMTEIAPQISETETDIGEALTYFEVVTAAAFKYFHRMEIDLAVLEVGMGGRWDATNVVDSEVAVVTNVGLDHVNELGHTKEEIALEKVGIIDEGSTAVTAEVDRRILMIISDRCAQVGADLKVFGRDFRLDYVVPYRVAGEPPAQFIGVRGMNGRTFTDVKLPLIGKHQAVNAACAVAAAQGYTEPRGRTDEGVFRAALETTTVPGRLDITTGRPMVVVDGAHNVPGVERLAASLTGDFDYERLVVVVAILEDKDARSMLRILGSLADEVVVTENRSARSIPAGKLRSYCRMEGIEAHVAEDFTEAMEAAYRLAGWDGLICVTGSLYTVSEARVFFKQQKATREMRQDR